MNLNPINPYHVIKELQEENENLKKEIEELKKKAGEENVE